MWNVGATLQLVALAMLGAIIALTVSDAKVFDGFRRYVTRWPFVSGAISCRYCFSHWVGAALLLIKAPVVISDYRLTNIIVSWGVLVWLINVLAGLLVKANE